LDFRDGKRGLVHCGPSKICKERLWKWKPFAIWGPDGKPKGGSFTGQFVRWTKQNYEVLLYWLLIRICEEGSGNGHLSPYGTPWGIMDGVFLYRGL